MDLQFVAEARRAFGAIVNGLGNSVPPLRYEIRGASAFDTFDILVFGFDRQLLELALQTFRRNRVFEDVFEVGARTIEF